MCGKFNIIVVDNPTVERRIKRLAYGIDNLRILNMLVGLTMVGLAINVDKLSTKVEELNKKVQ